MSYKGITVIVFCIFNKASVPTLKKHDLLLFKLVFNIQIKMNALTEAIHAMQMRHAQTQKEVSLVLAKMDS